MAASALKLCSLQVAIICSICDGINDVTWYCLHCKDYICKGCKKSHDKSHQIVDKATKDLLNSIGFQFDQDEVECHSNCYKCGKNKNVFWYCKECEFNVCGKCLLSHLSKRQTKQHKLIRLKILPILQNEVVPETNEQNEKTPSKDTQETEMITKSKKYPRYNPLLLLDILKDESELSIEFLCYKCHSTKFCICTDCKVISCWFCALRYHSFCEKISLELNSLPFCYRVNLIIEDRKDCLKHLREIISKTAVYIDSLHLHNNDGIFRVLTGLTQVEHFRNLCKLLEQLYLDESRISAELLTYENIRKNSYTHCQQIVSEKLFLAPGFYKLKQVISDMIIYKHKLLILHPLETVNGYCIHQTPIVVKVSEQSTYPKELSREDILFLSAITLVLISYVIYQLLHSI